MHRSLPGQYQPSPIFRRVGFRIISFEACSAFTVVAARMVAKSPLATRFIGVLQTISLPPPSAPIATGWSDSCRAGFAPARRGRLSTAHCRFKMESRSTFSLPSWWIPLSAASRSLGSSSRWAAVAIPSPHRPSRRQKATRKVPDTSGPNAASAAEVKTCLLDSPASQANRIEESLLELVRAGKLTLPLHRMDVPNIGELTDLELPHRTYDAAIGTAKLTDGTEWKKSTVAKQLREASRKNSTALLERSPLTHL